ncbi:hypothetical protein L2E82_49014 [Cichorium intybus]|uniref:Uncharacterized protein n=1 Tax=Cichorium intybus TaxID=13427 RepID=A0ACB8Z0C6_CICIN|nr:hypothetical protein L2E82_49014 [Cichorium intybus]
MDTEETVRFRLGNRDCSCTLREFEYRIGLYTEEESDSPAFGVFHRHASRTMGDSFSPADYWATIASTRYHENTIRECYMHLPSHRMLHRLITIMLWPRADEGKVLPRELHLMWSVTRMFDTCNIPYFITDYFKEITDAPMMMTAFGGGHFVTRLVESYGLISEHTTDGLEVIPPIILSSPVTSSREVIYVDDGVPSVDRMPFPALRSVPTTSRKSLRAVTGLPRSLSPATMESRFLADEVKALKEAMDTHKREHQIQSYAAHEVDKRTENTQKQLLWLADCMIALMAKNKCVPPRPHDQGG